MEKKSRDNCGRNAECRYPGCPCRYWIEKRVITATECETAIEAEVMRVSAPEHPLGASLVGLQNALLAPTMRKLDAMIREERR